MFGRKENEPTRRFAGRLLTVDTIVFPEGKQIRYGDMVVIRHENNKPLNRNSAVEDAMESFRERVGELSPQPSTVVGIKITESAFSAAEIVIVSGTPVWFD